jgi:multidrug efflux pump
MGGIVGRLFREFAVTLSMVVMVSLVLSLTTTPMLCAYVLKPKKLIRHGDSLLSVPDESPAPNGGAQWLAWPALLTLFGWLGKLYGLMQTGYAKSLDWVLAHKFPVLLAWFGTIAVTVYMYAAIPKGFFPTQDTGRLMGFVQADQSISFQGMREKLFQLMDIVQGDPAVSTVSGYVGEGQSGAGSFIMLKPLKERKISADGVIARLHGKLAAITGKPPVYLQSAQDIRIGGRSGRAMYQYTLQSDDLDELHEWTEKLSDALRREEILTDVNSDQEVARLQTTLVVDRDTATRLGVTMSRIDSALNDAFGQRQVSVMYKDRNQYRVVMEATENYLQGPDGHAHAHVRVPSVTGELIPLYSFASFEPTQAPLRVNHQGQMASATVFFNLKQGYALSDASRLIEMVKDRIGMPVSVRANFQGTAKVFRDSLSSQPLLIFAAIVTLYCPTLGGLKPPPFRRQFQHFFFFTFGSYDAYGNTWSARPSSEIF